MTGQVNFNSHTDAVVAVSAGLVNTATPGSRRGRPYPIPKGGELAKALTGALRARGHMDATQARKLVTAAGRLRVVFEQAGHGNRQRRTQAHPHDSRLLFGPRGPLRDNSHDGGGGQAVQPQVFSTGTCPSARTASHRSPARIDSRTSGSRNSVARLSASIGGKSTVA